jgi:hypothetical protein
MGKFSLIDIGRVKILFNAINYVILQIIYHTLPCLLEFLFFIKQIQEKRGFGISSCFNVFQFLLKINSFTRIN